MAPPDEPDDVQRPRVPEREIAEQSPHHRSLDRRTVELRQPLALDARIPEIGIRRPTDGNELPQRPSVADFLGLLDCEPIG